MESELSCHSVTSLCVCGDDCDVGAEDGDVVVVAVQWNAIGDQVHMEPIYDAIERAAYGVVTGSSKARQLREYDAWALVAVRGGSVPFSEVFCQPVRLVSVWRKAVYLLCTSHHTVVL